MCFRFYLLLNLSFFRFSRLFWLLCTSQKRKNFTITLSTIRICIIDGFSTFFYWLRRFCIQLFAICIFVKTVKCFTESSLRSNHTLSDVVFSNELIIAFVIGLIQSLILKSCGDISRHTIKQSKGRSSSRRWRSVCRYHRLTGKCSGVIVRVELVIFRVFIALEVFERIVVGSKRIIPAYRSGIRWKIHIRIAHSRRTWLIAIVRVHD